MAEEKLSQHITGWNVSSSTSAPRHPICCGDLLIPPASLSFILFILSRITRTVFTVFSFFLSFSFILVVCAEFRLFTSCTCETYCVWPSSTRQNDFVVANADKLPVTSRRRAWILVHLSRSWVFLHLYQAATLSSIHLRWWVTSTSAPGRTRFLKDQQYNLPRLFNATFIVP